MSKVLIAGAGGFIGGHMAAFMIASGYDVRCADVKPILGGWHQVHSRMNTERLCVDLSNFEDCRRACAGVDMVFNFAAQMGGMGFIENYRVECMRNVLINSNLIEAAYQAGVTHYLFASSACVYSELKQDSVDVTPLRERDAYPAMAERGYGWEKLYAEMLCEEYMAERGMVVYLPRFHNVYGPHGSWNDGREKAPAAICRKVAEAKLLGRNVIEVWGDGEQRRSFMWIDDCCEGVWRITNCAKLAGIPVNLGSAETVSINQLVDIVAEIAGMELHKSYKLDAPKGVAGRSSDNTFIRSLLNWEPDTPLRTGLERLYRWVEKQVAEGRAHIQREYRTELPEQ